MVGCSFSETAGDDAVAAGNFDDSGLTGAAGDDSFSFDFDFSATGRLVFVLTGAGDDPTDFDFDFSSTFEEATDKLVFGVAEASSDALFLYGLYDISMINIHTQQQLIM